MCPAGNRHDLRVLALDAAVHLRFQRYTDHPADTG